eukprot:NODE_578_length_1589_cov_96.040260_g474_i0.p1 GENE.NODE_578_length_1589_cov_96.040260_g474_i0~~NODE_578_length_1589_cov_96.040260_g474_i0.p1  ORF type:complete len:238 (-),score=25.60 NODE_578_length_1589_cov_96.040260_g474_i0:313-1026(-)
MLQELVVQVMLGFTGGVVVNVRSAAVERLIQNFHISLVTLVSVLALMCGSAMIFTSQLKLAVPEYASSTSRSASMTLCMNLAYQLTQVTDASSHDKSHAALTKCLSAMDKARKDLYRLNEQPTERDMTSGLNMLYTKVLSQMSTLLVAKPNEVTAEHTSFRKLVHDFPILLAALRKSESESRSKAVTLVDASNLVQTVLFAVTLVLLWTQAVWYTGHCEHGAQVRGRYNSRDCKFYC